MVGRTIPSRESHDLLLGHHACLVDLGRVSRTGVYDNEGASGRWRGVPLLNEAFQAFRGAFGMGVVVLKPADPESEGLAERANGCLETSFADQLRDDAGPPRIKGIGLARYGDETLEIARGER